MKNLVETAINAGTFKTLIIALREAGLYDILCSEGPYTIFAPTDEAFSKLPDGAIEKIMKDKEKLTDILTYHVIANRVFSKDVTTLQKAVTINGKHVKIKTGNTVKIDNARIIRSDIKCTNGVIHIIDEVLLPK
ncbi:MAG: fasciclin [Thermoplasmatales archaeon SG8-52-3]|nr:MAG: fasciclin [Thermoplasmatales archaeon SG8-52-3]